MATYNENHADEDVGTNVPDRFRDEFKKYKRRRPPPDFSEVIDFNRPGDFSSQIEEVILVQPKGFDEIPGGVIDVNLWKAYQLISNPGFLFIPNPFKQGSQRYWVQRCLKDYPVKPNHTNLDIHMTLTEKDNIWEDGSLESSNPFPKGDLISHLRWATLGYHYEWNNRVYFEDKVSEFPDDLSILTRYVAAALGYPNYCPQSGIVNFYNMESALCAHTDHSEYDKRAPLISYSFGQTAIFLIGGLTKEVCPAAVYLRSGDICVMMEGARLAFHAVPRILSAEPQRFHYSFHSPDCDSETNSHCDLYDDKDSHKLSRDMNESDNHRRHGAEFTKTFNNSDLKQTENIFQTTQELADEKRKNSSEKMDSWERYETYMKTARINVNVRQVLQHGQTFPKQETKQNSVS